MIRLIEHIKNHYYRWKYKQLYKRIKPMKRTIVELQNVEPNDFPLCEDWMGNAKNQFIADSWITLYCSRLYAVMVTDEALEKEKEDDSWFLNSSDMRPSFMFDDGDNVSGYRAYPRDDVFPIVITQEEKCYHTERVRLIDEFVLFYDLRIVERIDGSIEYYQIDETGDDILIATSYKGTLRVLVSYVKEFISIKNLNLVVQFDAFGYSDKSINEFTKPVEKTLTLYKSGDLLFSYSLMECKWNNYNTCSFIRGKSVIRHTDDSIKQLWNLHDKRFETFIAGKGKNGEPLWSTCDERQLNHLGNFVEGEPWQLSLVFFKRKVLDKYYADTRKFSVDDGSITGPEWFAHLDSDRGDGYVVMALKDLGKMPYKEQVHWKQYNIEYPSNAKLSDTTWKRWIAGIPSDTKNALDLLFKRLYESANKKWTEKYGFPLFLPLARGDQHFYDELRSMNVLSNDSVFDDQVLAFTKVTIDSLNEKELIKGVDEANADVQALCERCQVKDGKISNISGGIRKFEAFMYSNGIYNGDFITLLNKVQALRSSTAAHRKTTNPDKKDKELAAWFGLDKYTHKDVIDDLFVKYIIQLEWIGNL